MCLTGCSGVGKSVFYHTYFGTLDKFKNVSTSPNGDNNCKKIVIEGKGKATVSIWDTAGQEKYASITNIFYQNCGGVFILFDVTNVESFNQIESHWVKQLEK
jgi:GTPase SAR1 family protein